MLIWDRLPAHRGGQVKAYVRQERRWLTIEWLPPYAPELNPVEPLWDHLDDTVLANTPMEDLRRLSRRVHAGVRRVARRPAVGRGFLTYTGLF